MYYCKKCGKEINVALSCSDICYECSQKFETSDCSRDESSEGMEATKSFEEKNTIISKKLRSACFDILNYFDEKEDNYLCLGEEAPWDVDYVRNTLRDALEINDLEEK